MKLKVYGYNKCGTCRKAYKFLDENGIEYTKIPIREQPPAYSELEKMLEYMNGEIKKLFNTSGMDYRNGNYKEKIKIMTEHEALTELSANGNLIRRPFVLSENTGTVGFSQEKWEKLFAKQ